jgi:hypothetical protein
MKPFVKSTPPSPLLRHQESAIEEYQFINYSGDTFLCLCVVLVGPRKYSFL